MSTHTSISPSRRRSPERYLRLEDGLQNNSLYGPVRTATESLPRFHVAVVGESGPGAPGPRPERAFGRVGVWDSIRLTYGSLYAVAESLRKKGLVKASETRREGNRPERTVYTLTGEREHAMREWLAEMLRDPQPQSPTSRPRCR